MEGFNGQLYCFNCGEFYDPIIDPYHEEACEDNMAEEVPLKVKTIPELTNILGKVLDDK